jgi:nitroreductase
MDVWTAITTQRAVRAFSDRPIPDDAVERILDAGRRAPSSKNDQPWEFILVRDREQLRRLSETGEYAGHLAGATLAVAFVTRDAAPAALANDLYDLGHATQNMMLVALELGIGSVHAAVWQPDAARTILELPTDRRCDYLISLGYPARERLLDRPRRKVPRRPLSEILHHDRW